jgi:glutamine synthetase
LPLFAPNVNSFKRLRGYWEEGTPFNLNWGFENRTCGFRVPNLILHLKQELKIDYVDQMLIPT